MFVRFIKAHLRVRLRLSVAIHNAAQYVVPSPRSQLLANSSQGQCFNIQDIPDKGKGVQKPAVATPEAVPIPNGTDTDSNTDGTVKGAAEDGAEDTDVDQDGKAKKKKSKKKR